MESDCRMCGSGECISMASAMDPTLSVHDETCVNTKIGIECMTAAKVCCNVQVVVCTHRVHLRSTCGSPCSFSSLHEDTQVDVMTVA